MKHRNLLASVFKSIMLFCLIRQPLAAYRLAFCFIWENQRQALSMNIRTEAASTPCGVQSICIGFGSPHARLPLTSGIILSALLLLPQARLYMDLPYLLSDNTV